MKTKNLTKNIFQKRVSLALIFIGGLVTLALFYLIILGFVIVNFGKTENTNFVNNLPNSSSKNAEKVEKNIENNQKVNEENSEKIPENLDLKVKNVEFDTIIVLGAGLIDNSVSPVLKARIDHALNLYPSKAKSVIFTGGIGQNQKISEGEASFNYAIEVWQKENPSSGKNSNKNQEIEKTKNKNSQNNTDKKDKIDAKTNVAKNSQTSFQTNLESNRKPNFFFEKISKTTKQNLLEAQKIMNQNGFKTAIIVSDPLHLFRTNQIANLLQIKAQTSPTPFSVFQSFGTQRDFLLRELFFCNYFWLTKT